MDDVCVCPFKSSRNSMAFPWLDLLINFYMGYMKCPLLYSQCQQKLRLFFSSFVSTWKLWVTVLLNDCLHGQKEIRRIKVSSRDFFSPNGSYFYIIELCVFICFQSPGENSPFLSYFRGTPSCLTVHLQSLAPAVALVHQFTQFWVLQNSDNEALPFYLGHHKDPRTEII